MRSVNQSEDAPISSGAGAGPGECGVRGVRGQGSAGSGECGAKGRQGSTLAARACGCEGEPPNGCSPLWSEVEAADAEALGDVLTRAAEADATGGGSGGGCWSGGCGGAAGGNLAST